MANFSNVACGCMSNQGLDLTRPSQLFTVLIKLGPPRTYPDIRSHHPGRVHPIKSSPKGVNQRNVLMSYSKTFCTTDPRIDLQQKQGRACDCEDPTSSPAPSRASLDELIKNHEIHVPIGPLFINGGVIQRAAIGDGLGSATSSSLPGVIATDISSSLLLSCIVGLERTFRQ